MLIQLHAFASQRRSWLILALGAFSLEIMALIFQYGMDLKPCVYCIYVRLAFFALMLVALIVAIAPEKNWLRKLGFLGWSATSLWALSLNLTLHAKQIEPPSLFGSTCDAIPNFPSWAPLHEWLPGVFMPTGDCGDSPWSWLGLSMAQWLVGVSSLLLLIAAIFWLADLYRPKKKECCGGGCH
ncbi:disulfide bond formation protein DsbB [Ferrimonas aestuarii]|uniref:Disulfide bond formation protein B n=1 Tax=Ferrimonas aestuarii TaxID=2569539 RepID=A0A4U1BM71_9GAMM|nr:disulfide bond formation protein DsbB [Ferrimonas aestuarii]TKB54255.1 disulfide bond formation protein DsbB [Ferrimonas aestuarii]